ncbi:MAG: AI-2E family transporter [Planctomycetota bacterium]
MGQPSAPLTDQDDRVRTAALVVIAVIATGAALHWLAAALVPFALALFLSIALSPVVDALARRWRLSRTGAVLVAMALGGVLVVALGAIVAVTATQITSSADSYAQNLEALGARFMGADGTRFGRNLEELIDGALVSIKGAFSALSSGLLGGLLGLLSSGFSVFIFLMFLLLEPRRPEGGLAGLLDARVRGYVAVKMLTSSVTGVLVGGVLAVLGIDGALLFGLLTFLLNFIPTIGSIVAVLLPLPIVLAGATPCP